MIPWQIEYVGDKATVHLELRSMSPWQAERYLVKLGGEIVEKGRYVVGPDWEARLARGEPIKLGSLRIGVGTLDLTGSEEVLRRLMASLEFWLVRGGG